jgi:hypothetical protein
MLTILGIIGLVALVILSAILFDRNQNVLTWLAVTGNDEKEIIVPLVSNVFLFISPSSHGGACGSPRDETVRAKTARHARTGTRGRE